MRFPFLGLFAAFAFAMPGRSVDVPPGTMMYADTEKLGRPFSKDPSVVKFGDRYLMYFSLPGKDGQKGWTVGIAESHDLAHWQKVGELLPAQAVDKSGLCAPGALVIDGTVHLFYQSYGGGPKRRDLPRVVEGRRAFRARSVEPGVPSVGGVDLRTRHRRGGVPFQRQDFTCTTPRATRRSKSRWSAWRRRICIRISGARRGRTSARTARLSDPSFPGKRTASKRRRCADARGHALHVLRGRVQQSAAADRLRGEQGRRALDPLGRRAVPAQRRAGNVELLGIRASRRVRGRRPSRHTCFTRATMTTGIRGCCRASGWAGGTISRTSSPAPNRCETRAWHQNKVGMPLRGNP